VPSCTRWWSPGPCLNGHVPARRFTNDVEAVLRTLRPGQVVTYGEVAAEAGHSGAARAVGTVLRTSSGLPWWRVVAASGRVNPHAVAEATRLLRAEGVEVRDGRVIRRR
jgi:methylated-DNA-protein-cysteine methyltransferase related protein